MFNIAGGNGQWGSAPSDRPEKIPRLAV